MNRLMNNLILIAIEIISQSIEFCIHNKIYKATDMQSIAEKIKTEKNNIDVSYEPITIKTLNNKVYKIILRKSSISDYKNVMK